MIINQHHDWGGGPKSKKPKNKNKVRIKRMKHEAENPSRYTWSI